MILDKETFKQNFKDKLMLMFREEVSEASELDKYIAFGTLVTVFI